MSEGLDTETTAKEGEVPRHGAGVSLELVSDKISPSTSPPSDCPQSAHFQKLSEWVKQARAVRSNGKTGLTTKERVELAQLESAEAW